MPRIHEPASSTPRRLVSLPQDEPPPPVARQPWLYTAVLGNGRVLACLDATGSLAQLFYPHPDAGPALQAWLLGIHTLPVAQDTPAHAPEPEPDPGVIWLTDAAWTHTPAYVERAAVLHCLSTHASLPLQLVQKMAVHPFYDVLLNSMQLFNRGERPLTVRIVLYAGFDPGPRQRSNTCYFAQDLSSLLFFADDCYLALQCDTPVYGSGCARRESDGPDPVFQDACAGRFNHQTYATGEVRGSICYEIGQADPGQSLSFQVRLCFGRSLDDMYTLTRHLAHTRPQVDIIARWWQQQYVQELAFIQNTEIRAIAHRSLITLRLLSDASTGGMLAAPECDPDFTLCGGYGFCWPRDGALVGHTLDTFGCFDHARAFYDWALRVQASSGVWYQRYTLHGTLAPTWGLVQCDETGVIVWALCRHIQLSHDLAYGRKVFPQLLKACTYLRSELDAQTGLAPISTDLWEERVGISTYACACTWAAFHECALLSHTLGLSEEAEAWAAAAHRLKQAIAQYLWDASRQRFIRGIKVQARDCGIAHDHRPAPGQHTPSVLCRDTTIDTSLLGLSVPFAVFSPEDPRMLATAAAIEEQLSSPVGGIYRYQGDSYRGGNPWLICTLWLALQFLQSGSPDKGRQLYDWALQHRTALDLFPEQVDRASGQPCWVNPLGWSHAMFLLATRAISPKAEGGHH